MEDRGIDDWIGVFIVIAEDPYAFCMRCRCDQSSIGVLRSIFGEVFEGSVDRLVHADVVHHRTAPQASLFERGKIETCDYAEVVAAASESPVEVGMRGVVDVED